MLATKPQDGSSSGSGSSRRASNNTATPTAACPPRLKGRATNAPRLNGRAAAPACPRRRPRLNKRARSWCRDAWLQCQVARHGACQGGLWRGRLLGSHSRRLHWRGLEACDVHRRILNSSLVRRGQQHARWRRRWRLCWWHQLWPRGWLWRCWRRWCHGARCERGSGQRRRKRRESCKAWLAFTPRGRRRERLESCKVRPVRSRLRRQGPRCVPEVVRWH